MCNQRFMHFNITRNMLNIGKYQKPFTNMNNVLQAYNTRVYRVAVFTLFQSSVAIIFPHRPRPMQSGEPKMDT